MGLFNPIWKRPTLLFAYYSIIAGAPKQIIEVDPALWQWGGHVTYRILAPSIHHSDIDLSAYYCLYSGPTIPPKQIIAGGHVTPRFYRAIA